jgi:hypothetical protein
MDRWHNCLSSPSLPVFFKIKTDHLALIFTQKSKSDLGWNFLSVIETGRYKEYYSQNSANFENKLQQDFFRQLEFCQMEILVGPQKIMRWSVPDGARDPATGALLHDDLLISAALCTLLDHQSWGLALSAVIQGEDPLANLTEAL